LSQGFLRSQELCLVLQLSHFGSAVDRRSEAKESIEVPAIPERLFVNKPRILVEIIIFDAARFTVSQKYWGIN
jgi:hypothetical protein